MGRCPIYGVKMGNAQSDLVDPILRKLGISTPELSERNDCLVALNNLISSLSAERLFIHEVTRENFALTINDAEYTIGSGGDFNTVRPTKIVDAYLRDSTTDYPLEIRPIGNYNDIKDKTRDGLPTILYYLQEYPLGKILLNYEPDKAYVLYLNSWKQITEFAKLTTSVSLPLEYKRMLIFNTAVDLASEYDEALSPEVFAIASSSKRALQMVNSKPVQESAFDSALTYLGRRRDIDTDSII